MKFMINGAVTLGTLDGANVEIHEAVGNDNMVLFGMTTPEVNELKKNYQPSVYYQNNATIRKAIDEMRKGFGGISFNTIADSLVNADPYMVLADFDSYMKAQQRAVSLYRDSEKWQKMALANIAKSGRFAADRAIREYAENIWNASPVPEEKAGAAKAAAKARKPILKKTK